MVERQPLEQPENKWGTHLEKAGRVMAVGFLGVLGGITAHKLGTAIGKGELVTWENTKFFGGLAFSPFIWIFSGKARKLARTGWEKLEEFLRRYGEL